VVGQQQQGLVEAPSTFRAHRVCALCVPQLMNHEVQRAVLAALDADPDMQAYMGGLDTRVGGPGPLGALLNRWAIDRPQGWAAGPLWRPFEPLLAIDRPQGWAAGPLR
jgi:hypothetical protein